MTSSDRRVWQAFVQLADTLVADFDVIDFLHTLAQYSVDLLGVSASGILLADHAGRLNLVAASTEQARLWELSQLQAAEEPCVDAYRTGAAVTCPDLASAHERWPAFTAAALAAGFTAVHALPMRLRGQTIGSMSLCSAQPGDLSDQAADLGQALAPVPVG
jgi:GAF domain-containing protein